MGHRFISRLIQTALLLWLVTVVGFAILHLAPGGPLSQFTQVRGLTEADLQRLSNEMGLNEPFLVQYGNWIARLAQGDWGHSFRDNRPVLEVIFERIPATLELCGTAFVIAILGGGLIGIYGAINRYSTRDNLMTVGVLTLLSIPTFWLGLIAIYVFTIRLGWLPPGGRTNPGGDGGIFDSVHHLIAPALVLGLVELAVWARYTRASMLDVIGQDYIRTAKAKGLKTPTIIFRHALKNAVLPLVPLAALQFPILLGGALVTETVFTWPGMGRLFLESLDNRDYPVVMAVLLLTSILVIVANWVADTLSSLVDPRIAR